VISLYQKELRLDAIPIRIREGGVPAPVLLNQYGCPCLLLPRVVRETSVRQGKAPLETLDGGAEREIVALPPDGAPRVFPCENEARCPERLVRRDSLFL